MLSSKCYQPVLTAGGDALIDACGNEWTVVQWSAIIKSLNGIDSAGWFSDCFGKMRTNKEDAR